MKEILEYGFGLRGCRHLSTRQLDGPIVIELEPEKEPKAPERRELVRHGYRWRRLLPVFKLMNERLEDLRRQLVREGPLHRHQAAPGDAEDMDEPWQRHPRL